MVDLHVDRVHLQAGELAHPIRDPIAHPRRCLAEGGGPLDGDPHPEPRPPVGDNGVGGRE